jgi:large subunit ribosomal protein L19
MSLFHLAKRLQKTDLKLPSFAPGDAVRVTNKILEGDGKYRMQDCYGTLISHRRSRGGAIITIRRTFQGIGLEQTFSTYSPSIHKIEILRGAKTRRAKLYYLRNRKGRAARLRERLKLIGHCSFPKVRPQIRRVSLA